MELQDLIFRPFFWSFIYRISSWLAYDFHLVSISPTNFLSVFKWFSAITPVCTYQVQSKNALSPSFNRTTTQRTQTDRACGFLLSTNISQVFTVELNRQRGGTAQFQMLKTRFSFLQAIALVQLNETAFLRRLVSISGANRCLQPQDQTSWS